LEIIKEDCLNIIHKNRETLISLQEDFEKISENLSEKEEIYRVGNDKLLKFSEQYSSDREIFLVENRKNAEEIEKLETDLQKMRNDMASNYLKSQQSLQKATIR
jgi:SMC interacting uncharacterized protein involved in chromosome segregation